MCVQLDGFAVHILPPPYIDHTLQDPMLQSFHIRGSSEELDGVFNRLIVVVGCLPRTIPVPESLSKGLTGGGGILNSAKAVSVKTAV